MSPLPAELSLIRAEVEALYVTRDSEFSRGTFTLHDEVRYEHLIRRETVVLTAVDAL